MAIVRTIERAFNQRTKKICYTFSEERLKYLDVYKLDIALSLSFRLTLAKKI